jgi:hypothetical protein
MKKSPLRRATRPLRRSKGLARRIGLRPSRGREKAIVSPETRRIALARNGGRCACGCGGRSTQVHHVFPRQRWPALIDDPMNAVGVTKRCHERHELAVERLPFSAAILALEYCAQTEADVAYLERTYQMA